MRSRVSDTWVSFLLVFLGIAMLHGTVWSQTGSVLTEAKISNTQGNFTALLDNLDEFGGAVTSLGDLDGPGPSAVAMAVGVIGDDDGGSNRGAVYILFLNSAGSVLSYQKISDTQGNFTAVIDNADEFGSSVAWLGDLDGAGPSVAALAVGTTGDDDGGLQRGAVYVLFLNSAGSVLSYQKISDTAGNFTAVIDNGDELGGAVDWLGDLDGAGPSVGAVAVGAIGDDDGGVDRGAVYILFLASTGNVISYSKISDTAGNFTATLDDADQFGSSVSWLGDLDGAGPSVGALAVGAAFDDDGGSDRGAVYVIFLNSAGSALSYQKISDTAGNFTATLDNLDEFGSSVAGLGDVDTYGPSVVALAVGTVGDDDGVGAVDRGAVYILFLTSTGNVIFYQATGRPLSYQKISDTAGNFQATLDDGDDFGATVASLGDLDGPGYGTTARTLVVGAPGDDDGGAGRGATYVLYLDGVHLSDGPTRVPGTPTYVLGPAWPNPFNPRTTISYGMIDAGRVRIDIWDARGRLVRKLVRREAAAGEHRATWDGLDDGGRPMPSGTYVLRMSVNGHAVDGTRKAILLK